MASSSNDRAVSEMVSVLTLVLFAAIIVVAVGANVLFFQDDSGRTSAEFQFDYFDDANSLLITHRTGDTIPAGKILIRGPDTEATWAALNNNMNDSSPVGPNDAVQVGRSNDAYGQRVRPSHRVTVLYVRNETEPPSVLSKWNGTRG